MPQRGRRLVGEDLRPELRRLAKALAFFLACLTLFVIAGVIGVFH